MAASIPTAMTAPPPLCAAARALVATYIGSGGSTRRGRRPHPTVGRGGDASVPRARSTAKAAGHSWARGGGGRAPGGRGGRPSFLQSHCPAGKQSAHSKRL